MSLYNLEQKTAIIAQFETTYPDAVEKKEEFLIEYAKEKESLKKGLENFSPETRDLLRDETKRTKDNLWSSLTKEIHPEGITTPDTLKEWRQYLSLTRPPKPPKKYVRPDPKLFFFQIDTDGPGWPGGRFVKIKK